MYEISNENTYNLSFIGPTQGNTINTGKNISFADIDNNNKQDLIISAPSGGTASDIGYLYIIYDEKLNAMEGQSSIDLSDPSNYSLRFNGPEISTHNIYLSSGGFTTADIDGDGRQDLIIGAYGADFNGRGNSGSVYIIYNSKIQSYPTKNIDLIDENNYTLRIDGPSAGYALTNNSTVIGSDLDNDGKQDLLIGATDTFTGYGVGTGSLWIINNNLLQSYGSKNVDLADSNNFSFKINGATVDDQLSGTFTTGDIYNTGKQDLLIGAAGTGFNSRANSGSLYLLKNDLINSIESKTISLGEPENYSLRIDGATAQDKFTISNLLTANLTTDRKDILIGSVGAGYNSRSGSGSVWVISNSLVNGFQDKNIDLYNSDNYSHRIDGDASSAYLGKVIVNDFTGDGRNDLILGAPLSFNYYGSVFIIFNSNLTNNSLKNIDLANNANYDIRYNGPSSFSFFGNTLSAGYLDELHKSDVVIGAPMYGDQQQGGVWYINNFPHTLSLNQAPSLIKDDSFTLTGSVSAANSVTNIQGAQYSLNNSGFSGSWHDCLAVDGTFDSKSESVSCNIVTTGLNDGHNTIHFRAYDQNLSYTTISSYVSTSFSFDHTPPTSFSSHGGSNIMISDLLPTFSFDKSSDSGSGLSKYQILIDGSVYINNISTDTTSVTATTKLESGKSYKWRVRAIDNAGNTTSTDEKIIRINVRSVLSFSSSSFPLTILTLGGKPTNITSLHEDQVPQSFSISTSTPTIYGIANSGSLVTLRLERDNNEHSGRVRVFESTTTTGSDSRFGINITDKLVKGDYYLSLSATNDQGDYIELPEFTLRVGATLNLLTKRTTPPVSKAMTPVQSILEETSSPEPTAIPTPVPVESKQPKTCFLWWCW